MHMIAVECVRLLLTKLAKRSRTVLECARPDETPAIDTHVHYSQNFTIIIIRTLVRASNAVPLLARFNSEEAWILAFKHRLASLVACCRIIVVGVLKHVCEAIAEMYKAS